MSKKQTNHAATVHFSRGFTLIELLVVISIVGILATIVLSSLNTARGKSRDTARYGELVQLHTAIERYYSENGSYPDTSSTWYSSEPGDAIPNNGGNWIPGLVAAKMISILPRDPLGGQSTNVQCAVGQMRAFVYRSNGLHYKLLSYCSLEGAYPAATNPFRDVIRTTWGVQVTDNATFTNSPPCPGATCW